MSDAQAGSILFYRKLKTGFFVMTGFRGGNMPSGRLAECAAEKEDAVFEKLARIKSLTRLCINEIV